MRFLGRRTGWFLVAGEEPSAARSGGRSGSTEVPAPEQTNRMMDTWGKIEADTAGRPGLERLCWYLYADGSGGFTASEASDEAVVSAFGLETALALGEFLELDTRVVHDMDSAMPAITAAVARMNGQS